MLYKNRQKFSGSSERLGSFFGRFAGANAYTAAGLLLTILAAYCVAAQNFLAAAVIFAVAVFMDAVDGAVARYRREASKSGAYLDTIVDRYSEGIMALALVLVVLPALYLPSYVWAALYLFGSMMVTYSKAAAKEKGLVKEELKGGLMERPERAGLIIIGLYLGYYSPVYLTYVIALLAVLTNITALQRISIALKSAQK